VSTRTVSDETRQRISDSKRRAHAERVAQSHRMRELYARMLQLLGACEVILRERQASGEHDPLADYYLAEVNRVSEAIRAENIGAATILSEAEADAWSQVRA
jgi:hypothetical protein